MSSQNYSLDFSGSMPVAAQDGMAIAYDNADGFWKAIFSHCIFQAARRLPELTVDDVLVELEAVNVARKKNGQTPISTHNLAALGPTMMAARNQGIITATKRKVRSTTAHKHANVRTVWKSNFYSPSPRGENSSGTTAGSSGIPEQSIPVLPSKAGAAGELPADTSLVPTVPYKGGILA